MDSYGTLYSVPTPKYLEIYKPIPKDRIVVNKVVARQLGSASSDSSPVFQPSGAVLRDAVVSSIMEWLS